MLNLGMKGVLVPDPALFEIKPEEEEEEDEEDS